MQVAFAQVDAAHSYLSREMLSSDEMLSVQAEGTGSPLAARQIRDRLEYVLDHNVDDYGWSARLEMKQCLLDNLIYGTCFGLIEPDYDRAQATLVRLDPRDVYVDPGCPSPIIDRARAKIIRCPKTVDEIDAFRKVKGFSVPSKSELWWLAKNRRQLNGDTSKTQQELARGVRYTPPYDDRLPLAASNLIDIFIYEGGGREIWSLDHRYIMYNEVLPFKCSRLLSAPCHIVPNRFYAMSLVDILEPIQQIQQALLNRHLDEMALALNPPRAQKRSVINTPSSLSWRPGLVQQFENPKDDLVVNQPQGITNGVWQDMSYFDGQAQSWTGISPLVASGQATPGNANRTAGGIQAQQQGPMTRLANIAANFEEFFFVPLCYKILKVENQMAKEGVKLHRPRGGTY